MEMEGHDHQCLLQTWHLMLMMMMMIAAIQNYECNFSLMCIVLECMIGRGAWVCVWGMGLCVGQEMKLCIGEMQIWTLYNKELWLIWIKRNSL